jgi:hypothetical protein
MNMNIKMNMNMTSTNTNKRAGAVICIDDADAEENSSAGPGHVVKRVDVSGAQVRGAQVRTTKGEAQTLLRSILAALKPLSGTAAFPFTCLEIARSQIAPILDSPFNTRGTMLIRAETGDGRTLGLVLLLAAACATDGLSAIQAERQEFDFGRTRKTRTWLSWAKRVRRHSHLLTKHRLTSWSGIRHALFQDDKDTEVQPIEEDEDERSSSEMQTQTGSVVFECFQDHGDAVSIHTLALDNDDLVCHCCGIAWTDCDRRFYDCPNCRLYLCACCEERRINFK